MLDWLLILAGLVFLLGGGEGLVRGASGIALLARLSPAVVGLTIVAAGTSMPELVVSVQSAFAGSPGLAFGNVVGSNLFNVGAIVGVAALVQPLRILGNTVRLEWPVMMLASFQLLLLARDRSIDRLEGGFLFAALVTFMAYAVWLGRNTVSESEDKSYEEKLSTASFGAEGTKALLFNIAAIVIGAAMLAGGSTLLVRGAVAVASGLGVTDAVIGLTVVAAGTSAPELFASIAAARQGRDDIAVANVIGSSIFNILGILAVTALIHPLDVPQEILDRDIWWMLGACMLLFPLMRSKMRVTRIEGGALLAGFLVYMTLLVSSL